jgi:6-phosphogluconate dehydrogenase
MVHNGIEYSDMQLIGEAYQLLRDGLGLTAPQIAEVFTEWNSGDLDSFLVEITAEVLSQIDAKTGKPLVDVILDEAEQKGTGRWTVKSALDLGVPVTGIAEAVFARALSGRWRSAGPPPGWPPASWVAPNGRKAIHRGCAPGAVRVEDHRLRTGLQPDPGRLGRIRLGITPGDLATIWRGGCIIRAKFLNRIKEAFDENPDLPTLIVAPYFRSAIEAAVDGWRRVVVTATELGIPIPGFASALSYYDALRTERLPAALTQGLRDLFGAHTYGRIDADPAARFHTLWSGDHSEIEV